MLALNCLSREPTLRTFNPVNRKPRDRKGLLICLLLACVTLAAFWPVWHCEFVEYDDDFLTTALREAKEETGLDVELKAILNVSSTFLSPGQHFFSVYLLATVTGGELAAGDDLEAVNWFPITGPLPELAFQEDADILAAYAKNTFAGLPIDPNFAQVKASKVEPDLNTL